MKKIAFLLLLFVQQLTAQQTDVLFLGNSYTGVNNLPNLLYLLSLSAGDSISYDSNTPGGYTFQMHSSDPNSLAKINSRPWNYVILQGQSQEPSVDTPYVVANVFPYATQLNNLVEANDSCTQTIFYMTWGRKNGDASNCAAYPPVCTFLGMQGQLRNRYVQMANDNNAIVAPVGEAWKNVIATNPGFDLYMADESHPSLHGSYLTACVFYATIYKQSPLGLPYYAGLPVAEATILQTIAGSTVLDSMQIWNTEIYYPNANYGFTQMSSLSINAINSDQSATNWYWDNGTGNGFIQGIANQILNFPTTGTYNVCLAISNGCYSDTSCQTVNLATMGINSNSVSPISISPNPSDGNFVIHFNENNSDDYLISIYDASGKLNRSISKNNSDTIIEFELSESGIYFLTIDSQSTHYSQPIIVLPN